MAEDRPATSGRKRTGASYAHEWNRFVAWSESAGRRSLPASPEDVAAYLENRAAAAGPEPRPSRWWPPPSRATTGTRVSTCLYSKASLGLSWTN